MTADSSGAATARRTYYAYGTVRATDGLPTDYTFTAQKHKTLGTFRHPKGLVLSLSL